MSRESAVTMWCFTFQLTEGCEPYAWLDELYNKGTLSYLVGQMEKAPTTGQLHIQGFCQTKKRVRLAQMKALDGQAHWEHAKDPAKAREYCMKEDTREEGPWEFGQWRAPGRKTTLQDVCSLVLAGKSDYEIAGVAPEQFVRHFKGISALRIARKIPMEQRAWKPELWVIWGASGSGKSMFAQMNWGTGQDVYWKMEGNKWWDGYYGQTTVVLDDFKGSWMPLQSTQRLLDSSPLMVECKGGSVPLLAKRIVITSNTHPSTWYTGDEHGTIMRRVYDFARGRFIYARDMDNWFVSDTDQEWLPPEGIRCPSYALLMEYAADQ